MGAAGCKAAQGGAGAALQARHAGFAVAFSGQGKRQMNARQAPRSARNVHIQNVG
jgi:hypothetical protein